MKMLLIFTALVSVCITLQTASSSNYSNVPILKDDLGFYVNLHLTNDTTDPSDTVPMILGFYTSQIILVDSCLAFSSYNCTKYSCYKQDWELYASDYPQLWVDAYYAEATLFLGSNNWAFSFETVIASDCTGDKWFGFGRAGIIGMGWDIYASSPGPKSFFSIYINKEQTEGELLFEFNPKYAQSKTPVAILDSSPSGIIGHTFGKIQVGNNTYPQLIMAYFDLNSDSIGFPIYAYRNVTQFLEIVGSMNCTDDTEKPICLYHGKVKDLPTILLNSTNILDENVLIPIPPQVYVVNGENDDVIVNTITLNLRALAANLTGNSYQDPTYELIVFGYSFLSYYYTTFNATYEKVTLYLANHNHHEVDAWSTSLEDLEENNASMVSVSQGLEQQSVELNYDFIELANFGIVSESVELFMD